MTLVVETAKERQLDFGTRMARAPQYEGTETRSLYIPMRDGVKIAADIILPKDLPPGTEIPALLLQTRYWRASELRAPFKWFLTPEKLAAPEFREMRPFFVTRGYAIVVVDVRGTGASFGTWHPWSKESVDNAREVVDWIVAQPWSSGKVGGYGGSYLGTTAELLAALNHPAVGGVIPMFNHPDPYTDIAFPGGVFDERFIKEWSDTDSFLDQNVLPPLYPLLVRLLLKGVKPVDADRDCRELNEAVRAHRENVHAHSMSRGVAFRDERSDDGSASSDDVAVHRFKDEIERSDTATFGWASWMDAGTADAAIRRFLTFDNAQRAVIGAWEHGGRFNASPYRPPDAPTSPGVRGQWSEMLSFFDCHLKGADNGVATEKALFYYTMGEEKWKRTDVWPPQGASTRRWYMSEDKTLSVEKPAAEAGSDRYTVDFDASTGEYNRWWELGILKNKTVFYGDRAPAARRLLTYTSPPMAEDTEITGYPIVTLYVTSTETDGAFFVYVEDIDEAGHVYYVTEGQLRAIHRKVSDETPPYRLQVPYHSFKKRDSMPLAPGETAEITFGLHPTSALIRKGHRIRVGIAGHDKGTFVRIPAQGNPVITVARNSLHASHIDLPVVPRR